VVAGLAVIPGFGIAVAMPFGSRNLPVFLVAPVALAPISAYPLIDWFPSFSAQVVREGPRQRGARAAGAVVVMMSGLLGALGEPRIFLMAVPTAVMTGVGMAAVVLLGSLYWLALLVTFLGMLPFVLSATGQSWFFEVALDVRAAAAATAVLAAAATLYVLAGVRRKRPVG